MLEVITVLLENKTITNNRINILIFNRVYNHLHVIYIWNYMLKCFAFFSLRKTAFNPINYCNTTVGLAQTISLGSNQFMTYTDGSNTKTVWDTALMGLLNESLLLTLNQQLVVQNHSQALAVLCLQRQCCTIVRVVKVISFRCLFLLPHSLMQLTQNIRT